MTKYLLEVPHAASQLGCLEAIEAFLHSGSHFLMNADWGCKDGEHKAWLIIDAEDKEQAKTILPAGYRANAKITMLSRFSREEVEKIKEKHLH